MIDLLGRRRLTHARLRLRVSPILLVCQGHLAQVAGKRFRILRELLGLAANPSMQRAPKLEDIISNTLIPTDITRDRVRSTRVDIREENSPLASAVQHRGTLSHGGDNVAREIGTEGDKVHHRLRVQEGRRLGNLLILPCRNLPVRTPRNLHRSPEMKLLNGEVIYKDLRQNLRLALSSPASQEERKHANQKRDERGYGSSNCGNGVPVPRTSGSLANLDDDTHLLFPWWTGGHSAMPMRPEVPAHG